MQYKAPARQPGGGGVGGASCGKQARKLQKYTTASEVQHEVGLFIQTTEPQESQVSC